MATMELFCNGCTIMTSSSLIVCSRSRCSIVLLSVYIPCSSVAIMTLHCCALSVIV